MQDLGDIFISSCNKATRKRGCFFNPSRGCRLTFPIQRFREMQSLGDIFISRCNKATRKRGLVVFLNRQKLEKIQKEYADCDEYRMKKIR